MVFMNYRPFQTLMFKIGMLALTVLLPSTLSAMERTAGALRVELLPTTSSFQIYLRTQGDSLVRTSALQSSESVRSIPLLYPDDPTTSFFSLLEDGRVYQPARDRSFRRSLIETDTGYPAFVFASRDIEVRQTFVPHPGRRVAADAIEIRFEIFNSSTRPRTIALRYVLDTYLGEASGIHGVLELGNGNQQIPSHEISVDPSAFRAVRTTRDSAAPSSLGLRIPFTTEEAGAAESSTPEKVLIANWRRVLEAGWDYSPVPGRGFSYPPYSRNDSALVLFYPETTINPGEKQQISIVLQATPGELTPPRTAAQTEEPVTELARAETETIRELERTVAVFEQAALSDAQRFQRRIELVDAIISEIDRSVREPGELNEPDLLKLEQLLQRLEQNPGDRP